MPARKLSVVPTRILVYGAVSIAGQVRNPESNLDLGNRELIESQLQKANDYRNKLVELRQRRNQLYNEAMATFPAVAELIETVRALSEQIDAHRTSIKEDRAERRARGHSKAVADLIKSLKAERKIAVEKLKAAKAEQNESDAVIALNTWHREAQRQARAETDVYWGTYGRIEAAIERTKITGTKKDFRRYDGTGTLGVQIQLSNAGGVRKGGLRTEGLLACTDTRARLELLPEVPIDRRSLICVRDKWYVAAKSYRSGDLTVNGHFCYSVEDAETSGLGDRAQLDQLISHLRRPHEKNTRAVLHLRIGSNGKQPVWGTFPVLYHRPLPPNGDIKAIWVQRRKAPARGTLNHPDDGFFWEACFVVESETFETPARTPTHTAALNLGFRLLDDGASLRVAYLVGTDGLTEEITLDAFEPVERAGKAFLYAGGKCRKKRPGVWNGIEYATTKHGARDNNFNVARKQLVSWLSDNADVVPEWLTDRTKTLPHWKRIAGLTRLVRDWRSQRFLGDEAIYSALLQWARVDRHDDQHESGVRERSYGRREQQYRETVSRWCKRYSTIRLPDMDLTRLKRRAKPEDGESSLETVQRRQFNTAAMGTLVGALKLAASNSGTTIEVVDVTEHQISSAHHACGNISESDRAKKIELYCEQCQHWFDQDENAARNLLSAPPSSTTARIRAA